MNPVGQIRDFFSRSRPLAATSLIPSKHYHETSHTWSKIGANAVDFDPNSQGIQPASDQVTHVRLATLVNLVECFERFLKEVAAVCVDALAPYTLDHRFEGFRLSASSLAIHYAAGTIGRALCEGLVWLDCDEINDRFRKLLAKPFEESSTFYLFPKTKGHTPASEIHRYEPMSVIWQIRNAIVHNVGVLTESDAIKLRLLTKIPIESPRQLNPDVDDLIAIKQFLDDTVERINARVGERLAELLTMIHSNNPHLFDASQMANSLSEKFQTPLTIDGATGVAPSVS